MVIVDQLMVFIWVSIPCSICFGGTYCHHLQGDCIWFVWMLKWWVRFKYVAYVEKLEEIWPIRAMGGQKE
jgi:hypothetical protein